LEKEVRRPDEREQAEERPNLIGGDEALAALLGDLLDDWLLSERPDEKGKAGHNVADRRLILQHERRSRNEIDESEDERQRANEQIEACELEPLSPAPNGVRNDEHDRAEDRRL